ncbi:MAG TPA: DciA family protein [Tepidisphaeraceae bacterium]|nr:DciA family protein [Tepidisphaeraceae bacterium]
MSAKDRENDRTLNRLWKVKHAPPEQTPALGPEMLSFFKKSVQKRQGKQAAISECWQTLVPQLLNDHCALESFHAGTLKVIVDSSSHLYELKQLLLSGLQQQLLIACKSAGLRKITLKPGRWYEGDGRERKIRFG